MTVNHLASMLLGGKEAMICFKGIILNFQVNMVGIDNSGIVQLPCNSTAFLLYYLQQCYKYLSVI